MIATRWDCRVNYPEHPTVRYRQASLEGRPPVQRGCIIWIVLSRSQVRGASISFRGAVIVIVAEGWPYLRFEFNAGYQLSVHYNKKIPFLLWTVPAGQLETLLAMDVGLCKAILTQ